MATITDTSNQAASLGYNFVGYATPALTPETVSRQPLDSPYLNPVKPYTTHPSVPGYTDISPESNGSDFGQSVNFKWLENETDTVTAAWLYVRLAPLTSAAPTGNECYPDDVLCHAMESFEWQVAGRESQSIYGDQIHFDNLVEHGPVELARRYQLQHAGLSPAQRRAEANLAGTGFWAILELPLEFSESLSASWHSYLTKSVVRFTVRYRPTANILQNTGANTPTPVGSTTFIVDQFLRFKVASLHEGQKSLMKKRVKDTGTHGMLKKFKDIQRVQSHAVAATAANTQIDISNFTKHVYRIQFVVRPAVNLAANINLNDRWALTDISTCWIDAAGKRLIPQLDDATLKYIVNGQNFKGVPGDAVYNALLTDYPDVHHNALGGIDFSLTGNPRLNITWSAVGGLVAASEIDVWAYCHNMIKYVETQGKVVVHQLYQV